MSTSKRKAAIKVERERDALLAALERATRLLEDDENRFTEEVEEFEALIQEIRG